VALSDKQCQLPVALPPSIMSPGIGEQQDYEEIRSVFSVAMMELGHAARGSVL